MSLLDTNGLIILNLQKSITRKQAKSLHADLPAGGEWRTIKGNHVYIKDGMILAGAGVGKTGKPVKLNKKALAEHFASLNGKEKKASETKKASKPAAKTVKQTDKQAVKPKASKAGSTKDKPVKQAVKQDVKQQMKKQRDAIDEIVNTSNNKNTKTKRGTVTKDDIEELRNKPQPKKKAAGASKKDIEELRNKPEPKKAAKGATKADLDAMLESHPKPEKKEPDYAGMQRMEFERLYADTIDKFDKETDALFNPEMDKWKKEAESLRAQSRTYTGKRMSKAQQAAYKENEQKYNHALHMQQETLRKSREHLQALKDNSPIVAEMIKRREQDDRKMTGDLLPEEEQALNASLGVEAFNPQTKLEKFYRLTRNGWDTLAVSGVPVDLGHGLEGFIHVSKDYTYTVHNAKSGERLITHYPPHNETNSDTGMSRQIIEQNLKRAVNLVRTKMARLVNGDEWSTGIGKEALQERAAELVKKNGLSPRYDKNGEVKASMRTSKAVPAGTEKAAPKSKPAKKTTTFHVINRGHDGGIWQEREGVKVNVHPELETFYHKEDATHTITEARSGLAIGRSNSKRGAIEMAQKNIEKLGMEKVHAAIKRATDANGESPSSKTNGLQKSLNHIQQFIQGWRMGE